MTNPDKAPGSRIDQIIGHGDDNDGIEEYDNDLPLWWRALFYGSCIWAAGYWINATFIDESFNQASWYEVEMAAAAEMWPDQGPASAADAITPERIAEGKEVYGQMCGSCHGANLEGGVGPMLSDDVWIHGGSFEEIAHTITVGVTEKGMLAWGPILGAEKIGSLAAFIYDASGGAEARKASPKPTTTAPMGDEG